MPDPIAFQPQSSASILGNIDRDKNVLYRGRITLTTSTQGPQALYAPYYYASHSLNFNFLNTVGLFPKVEVFAKTGTPGSLTFTQCPYFKINPGTLNPLTYANVRVFDNVSKATGYSLGLFIELFHQTQNTSVEFYYTVFSSAIGASDSALFINDGTFSA